MECCTSADSFDGQGEGIFSMGGMEIAVSLHFHYKNSGGPELGW
jgi:hypothetical protein